MEGDGGRESAGGRGERKGAGRARRGAGRRGARAHPHLETPQLWASTGEGLMAASGRGRESAAGGAGESFRGRGEQRCWRNEPGFRAAINEARGGQRGLHGLGGHGLPRRARHSFPLNWAPGPAPPPPSPVRVALGRPAGARAGVAGPWGAGSKSQGGPLRLPEPFPRSPLNPRLPQGRGRCAHLPSGEPESREGGHCCA